MSHDPSHQESLFTRRLDRRTAVTLIGLSPLLGLSASVLSGCGGGGGGGNNDDNYVTTTTGYSGSFAGTRIGPSPGSVYISSGTTFQIAWPDPNFPPPPQFTVSLMRYQEARGSADREVNPQKITVTPASSSTPAWNIQRRDGFSLDTDGVYYLQITSPGQTDIRAAYIIASGRAVPVPTVAPTRVTTGSSGSVANVQLSPTPGTVFLPKHTTFQVSWAASAPPPPSFDINLVRYQEARGGEDRSVTTQKIDVNQIGTYTWTAARKDNFDLDVGGTYYLEVTAPGENPVRAAYLVSLEL